MFVCFLWVLQCTCQSGHTLRNFYVVTCCNNIHTVPFVDVANSGATMFMSSFPFPGDAQITIHRLHFSENSIVR